MGSSTQEEARLSACIINTRNQVQGKLLSMPQALSSYTMACKMNRRDRTHTGTLQRWKDLFWPRYSCRQSPPPFLSNSRERTGDWWKQGQNTLCVCVYSGSTKLRIWSLAKRADAHTQTWFQQRVTEWGRNNFYILFIDTTSLNFHACPKSLELSPISQE